MMNSFALEPGGWERCIEADKLGHELFFAVDRLCEIKYFARG